MASLHAPHPQCVRSTMEQRCRVLYTDSAWRGHRTLESVVVGTLDCLTRRVGDELLRYVSIRCEVSMYCRVRRLAPAHPPCRIEWKWKKKRVAAE